MKPGYYLFKGARHIKAATYEHIHEPLEIAEINIGQRREVGVVMLGRQQKFQLKNFIGTWTLLETENP